MPQLKIGIILLTIICFAFASTILIKSTTGQCKEYYVLHKGDFKFVAYGKISKPSIIDIHDKLKNKKDQLLEYFNLNSMSNVTVKIWSNEQSYLSEQEKAIGAKYPGSTGYVVRQYYPKNNEIRLLNNSQNLAQTALHEFVHLVTLEVNPQFGNNPRWLWEAIAIYKSEEAWKYADKPHLIQGRFDTLTQNINAGFNESGAIYELGYTIGEYIDKTWGREAFSELINSNGNITALAGQSLDEIILDWKRFVEVTYFSN